MDKFEFFNNVRETVPGYKDFISGHPIHSETDWNRIPLTNKQNYLLHYPVNKLIREGSFKKCFLIGASSGFSKSGTVWWLKQSEDEGAYIEKVKELFIRDYRVDKKSTLVLVSLALGTWIGGMQLACTLRSLAGKMDGIVTATPGIDLNESIQLAKTFGKMFDQIIWITNPSSINIIYARLKKEDKELLNGKIFFPVVGEYFTENFREKIAENFGHSTDNVYVVKTGYGSADTGDLGIERESTIRLRKFLNRHPELSEKLMGDKNPPMFFEKSHQAYIETINGNLVVTKDQFIPLVRYNTHDTGGLIKKETFRDTGIDPALYNALPDEILYVFGRTSDSVIFYGTNLNIYASGDYLNMLDTSFSYGGLYEVKVTEENDIQFVEFTIYVLAPRKELSEKYRQALIRFLKSSSNEFNAKYDRLKAAAGQDLIRVKILPVTDKNLAQKHHTIKN
jgi:phenylacetate-CoA ligase